MKKAAVVLAGLFLLVAGVWFIVLPGGLIKDLIEHSLGSDVVYLKADGFRKGLFYDFSARKILLRKAGAGKDSDVTLLEFDDVNGRLDLLSVAAFRPRLNFSCKIGDGVVTGRVGLTGKGPTKIVGGDIHLEEVPFLEPFGIHGGGTMSGSFEESGNKSDLELSLINANLSSTTFMGVFLPLEIFHEVRAAATITDGVVDIQSLALSGDGLYGRVRGSVRGGNMDMSLELMTDPSFKLAPLLQAMVERYRVSPGYYVFPLRGEVPHGQ